MNEDRRLLCVLAHPDDGSLGMGGTLACYSAKVRGRVMSIAYLPVNLGFFLGPALGARLVQADLMAIFPVAGLGVVLRAARRPARGTA
ncbi:MAG: hypothetical protein NTY23_08660 [Chloroflexi bacterium]|nr:hypothetical protein [Chloroflexota bacterium]